LLEAALKRKNQAPPDDVTAVVIRMEHATALAMEGIA
jgi:hypothetical protein